MYKINQNATTAKRTPLRFTTLTLAHANARPNAGVDTSFKNGLDILSADANVTSTPSLPARLIRNTGTKELVTVNARRDNAFTDSPRILRHASACASRRNVLKD